LNIINESYWRLSKNRVLTIEAFIASLALFFQVPQVFAGRPFDGTDPALVGINEFELKLGPLDFKRDTSK
jgi:hypothetical protein